MHCDWDCPIFSTVKDLYGNGSDGIDGFFAVDTAGQIATTWATIKGKIN